VNRTGELFGRQHSGLECADDVTLPTRPMHLYVIHSRHYSQSIRVYGAAELGICGKQSATALFLSYRPSRKFVAAAYAGVVAQHGGSVDRDTGPKWDTTNCIALVCVNGTEIFRGVTATSSSLIT